MPSLWRPIEILVASNRFYNIVQQVLQHRRIVVFLHWRPNPAGVEHLLSNQREFDIDRTRHHRMPDCRHHWHRERQVGSAEQSGRTEEMAPVTDAAGGIRGYGPTTRLGLHRNDGRPRLHDSLRSRYGRGTGGAPRRRGREPEVASTGAPFPRRRLLPPVLLPRIEFGRRQPEPGDVAFMQAHHLRLDDIDQSHAGGRFAARRDTRLLTSSNGWRYGSCTMAKNACSNGSSIAVAVSRIFLKHSSMSCGISRG